MRGHVADHIFPDPMKYFRNAEIALNNLICALPTGEARNKVTDANISMLQALDMYQKQGTKPV